MFKDLKYDMKSKYHSDGHNKVTLSRRECTRLSLFFTAESPPIMVRLNHLTSEFLKTFV